MVVKSKKRKSVSAFFLSVLFQPIIIIDVQKYVASCKDISVSVSMVIYGNTCKLRFKIFCLTAYN